MRPLNQIVRSKAAALALAALILLALLPTALALQAPGQDGWHMLEVREIQVVPHGSTVIFYFSFDMDIFMKFYSWVVGARPVEDYLRSVIVGLEGLETVSLNPLGGEVIFRLANATSYNQGWYYYTESHPISQPVGRLRVFATVLGTNSTYYDANDTQMLPSFYYRG